MRAGVAVVCWTCLCGRFLAGEDAPAPSADPKPGVVVTANESEPAALVANVARKVSFEFVDTPLEEGITFLVSFSKAPLRFDQELRVKEITLEVRNISLRDALRQIADKAGANVYYVDGVYWLSKSAPVPTKDLLPAPKKIPVLTDEEQTQASAAIKALGNDDYADRDAAQKALRKLGLGVFPLLREAYAVRPDDPERRTQVAALIKECEALQEAGPMGLELALALKRPISLDLVDTPLDEVADYLSRKTMPVKAAPVVKNVAVTGNFKDVELGSVLRWIARLSNTTLVYSEDGVTFASKRVPGQPALVYGKP